jgi:hypothetical protein
MQRSDPHKKSKEDDFLLVILAATQKPWSKKVTNQIKSHAPGQAAKSFNQR